MMAQGGPAQWSPHFQQGGANAGSVGGFYGITSYQVAQACPDAAAYSLHLPLQHCREKVQRILQFVEAECEVLPSKERCPYVLVAELLEQPFTCKSDELFTHRRVSGAVGAASGSGSGSVGAPRVDDIVAGVSGESESSFTLGPGPGPGPGPGGGGDAATLGHLQPQTTPAWTQHPQQQQQPQPQSQPQQHEQQHQYNAPPHTYPQNLYQQPQHNSPYSSFPGAMLPHTPTPQAFATIKSVEDKVASIRSSSPFGHLPGWGVKSFIVKSGDDLRKELLAMQVIDICQHVFQLEGLDLSLHPYQIISTGPMAGLVEFVEGTMSLDRMKKSAANPAASSLKHYFEFAFGHSFSPAHQRAVQNFVRSLAGYSLMTYLLQVRDRHNANLLIDAEGHIVHIDYGFILGDSPGFNINFENAPFKFTKEYVEVLGGFHSPAFKQFEDLFVRGYFALQKHQEALAAIVQLFYGARGQSQADGIRQRLGMRSPEQVISLISDSFDNWRTTQYDRFQKTSNNIFF